MYIRELDGDPPADHTRKCSHPLCKNRFPCYGELVRDEDGGGCRDCERWVLCDDCEARARKADEDALSEEEKAEMVKQLATDLAEVLEEQPDEIAASLNRSLEEQ